MSGHSKWANIKHKKGKMDAARGKIATKLGREITIAVRMGGSDPTGNMRLKLVLAKAKANNIPKDNIQRAIQKGLGGTDGANYEELTYEGYGPSGVAVMVNVMTDNRNRAAAEIRHLFSKYGGNLGETGCVGWMFQKKGMFVIESDTLTEDDIMEIALEADAEGFEATDDGFEITTTPEGFDAVDQILSERGIQPSVSEVTMLPDTMMEVDAGVADKVMKLIEALEDNDDVQDVYTNADFPEEN
ncbi:MAG: YebC/PmpR family DNA-binding transcriptional regulator [Selenomonadales bacterium]|jgi:YebC/PmpR family DNA-binding regulatory protein|nr:YebC/PmpR family DNA-binding transcriptional regulator [Selenomonadales bacterium]MBQ5636877.1 YebC/PmpR family DNA-binding transcriptional regulator [Selenomonadales bacterium]MBR0325274.1 YebC/PmpR family DNA-binding transcriptional regulator [Selenomonadales bacterium]